MSAPDVREALTKRIVDLLEKGGTLPWHKPWTGRPSTPYNALTGAAYRGVNRLWLGFSRFTDPRWLTYRQVDVLSERTKTPMHVRKGERGTPVEKWLFEREERRISPETGRTETVTVSLSRPVALAFTVFNAEQIEGMPPPPAVEKEMAWPSDVLTSHIVECLGARVCFDGGDRAFYRRSDDTIHLPVRSAFDGEAGYNSTLLHELVHWTGHEGRLAAGFGVFGSEEYAFEELRAEIGSYYLNVTLGLSNDLKNHASYVDSWLGLLRKDKHVLPRALRLAGQAEEYVLGQVLEKEREPGIQKRLGAHLEKLGVRAFTDGREQTGESWEKEEPGHIVSRSGQDEARSGQIESRSGQGESRAGHVLSVAGRSPGKEATGRGPSGPAPRRARGPEKILHATPERVPARERTRDDGRGR